MTVKLPDLVNVSQSVEVRGVAVAVRGLKLEEVIMLLVDLPGLGKAMDGKTPSVTAIMQSPAIMAAVLGKATDLDAESVSTLTAGEQAKLLAPVVKQTMPDGIGPFVELLEAVTGSSLNVPEAVTKAASSMKLRPRPQGSSGADTAKAA